jgi:hypothetical protein
LTPHPRAYREVTPPERLVYAEIYDVAPFNSGDPAVNTVTFAEEGGRKVVTTTTVHPSKDVRDFVLRTGMEDGAAESMDRLASSCSARCRQQAAHRSGGGSLGASPDPATLTLSGRESGGSPPC